MVPVSDSVGDASSQEAHAQDASREIMQSLFKDLGKQAMALEAILRVVCGKVDRMESWMTTISFGMSELDLKLRNIAHNIDGTSAVDDDVVGKQPWAVPPPDDDIASARAVPVLSKKVGPNKKQVRVTGMAAAIIDKLAAEPKSTSEKTSKKKKPPPASPPIETPKKSLKKKKVHDIGDSQQLPAKNEIIETLDPKAEAMARTNTEAGQTLNSPPEPYMNAKDLHAELPEEPANAHSIDCTDIESSSKHSEPEYPQELPQDCISTEDVFQDEIPEHVSGLPQVQERVIEDSDTDVASGSAQSSSQPTPREEELSRENLEVSIEDSTTDIDHKLPQTPEGISHPHVLPTETSSLEQPKVAAYREAISNTSLISVPHSAEATFPLQPSGSNTLPTMNAIEKAHDFALCTPISDPVELSVSQENSPELASPCSARSPTLPTSSHTGGDDGQTQVSPSSSKSRRSSLIGRVLTMHAEEKSKQKFKQSQRSSSSKSKKPKSGSITLTNSEVDDSEPPANSVPSNKLVPPTIASEAIKPLRNEEVHIHSFEAKDLSEEQHLQESLRTDPEEEADSFSSDSDSGSSSDASGSIQSSSDDSDDKDDNEDVLRDGTNSNAASSHPSASKRTSIAAGSAITKTMTALKKLKKAHMLTPEEEEEIKQRAHEKWFKLKGHIKEKQKKEVANILLKRKKNVFTVSSRIELLEEKSREIFASIKQIGNELKLKSDQSTHDALRRQVADMQRTLQLIDVRLGKMAAQLTPEKVLELGKQFDSLRAGIADEMSALREIVSAHYTEQTNVLQEHSDHLRAIDESIPQLLSTQASEFEQRLLALPDFGSAIEGLRRAMRRKADLKLLKELEARLLGHTFEGEDCLVRCLSCHKEVIELQHQDAEGEGEESSTQLKKVNPGPSSAKIYRSNVPFHAEPSGGAIDRNTSDASSTVADGSASEQIDPPSAARRGASLVKATPISRLSITSVSSPASPDRPISAPAAARKKKTISTVKPKHNS